ncbi:MAG TPA: hypothetical protein VKX39_14770 [Bryobacteraceae bacterium]|jgi:hypothetical protein|nr:hypothetical protein [Bryobacteraceae bacterium]
MFLYYDVTPEEDILIDECCAWLDDQDIELCLMAATRAADEITEPEAAQEQLVKTLTEIIVRGRRAEREGQSRPADSSG